MENFKIVSLDQDQKKNFRLISKNYKFNLYFHESFFIQPHGEDIYLQFTASDIITPGVEQMQRWFKKANGIFAALKEID